MGSLRSRNDSGTPPGSFAVPPFQPLFAFPLKKRLRFEVGIKQMAGKKIRVPRSEEQKPDRERLEIRFKRFKKHAA